MSKGMNSNTTKQFCDTEMAQTVQERDEQKANIEDFQAQISGKTAEQNQLRKEIAGLSAQIAANKKAFLEASTLRNEENAENGKTIPEAIAGKEAVEEAIAILKEFYQPSLLQRSGYVPPDSDREGKTVADRAPGIFDSEYQGAQEASKGILGMLQVILIDFDRTDDTVSQDEHLASDQFRFFKIINEQDTTTKEGAVQTKKGKITLLEDELVTP